MLKPIAVLVTASTLAACSHVPNTPNYANPDTNVKYRVDGQDLSYTKGNVGRTYCQVIESRARSLSVQHLWGALGFSALSIGSGIASVTFDGDTTKDTALRLTTIASAGLLGGLATYFWGRQKDAATLGSAAAASAALDAGNADSSSFAGCNAAVVTWIAGRGDTSAVQESVKAFNDKLRALEKKALDDKAGANADAAKGSTASPVSEPGKK
jgi:hypothetical protein